MKFHFVVPVWGEEYVSTFLDVCLPNQLTLGNLLAFTGTTNSVYKIYTTTKDAETIASHRVFKVLQKTMRVEFALDDQLTPYSENENALNQNSLEYRSAISSMTKCHRIAVKEANDDGAIILFPGADAVYSEGAFSKALDHVKSGKRVVLIVGTRVVKETFVGEFKSSFQNKDGSIIAASRDMVKLALKHFHPTSHSLFVDSDRFTNNVASQIFWKVGDEGIVARCFILHPLLIYPEDKTAEPVHSIDFDYVFKACPTYSTYHIVTDSDELVGFEFSSLSKHSDMIKPSRFNVYKYARYYVDIMKSHPNSIHSKYLLKKIKLHGRELSQEYNDVGCQSDRVIKQVLMIAGVIKKYGQRHSLKMKDIGNVVVFGAGKSGEYAIKFARKIGWHIVRVVDNDPAKWGNNVNGFPVENPTSLQNKDFNLIIVASYPGKKAIFVQLGKMGFLYKKDFIYFMDRLQIGDYDINLNPVSLEDMKTGFNDGPKDEKLQWNV